MISKAQAKISLTPVVFRLGRHQEAADMIRLRSLAATGCILLGLTAPGSAQAGGPVGPQGDWLTPGGRARVHIAACGAAAAALCGTIVWLKQPNDPAGAPLRDGKNGDAALRGRPILGLQILNDVAPAGALWRGRIYDPESGRTYAAKIRGNPDGGLIVEGCLAVICRAQVWRRAGA
jgi:uncharacterized protein (DUF2147 family)